MDLLSDHPLEGKSFGQYVIERKLGRGGMGVVYLARDTNLQRNVALKFLPPDSTGESMQLRFINEARAASALDHPNICTIYDASTTPDGLPYIVMAYYDGSTLGSLIASGELELSSAIKYAKQCASGLARAHSASIIHRDIKPSNLHVTSDGVLKILDFGIAKLPDVQLTQTDRTVGTLSYMAPEQIRGEIASPSSDIWSLGATLYEMACGSRPFDGSYDAAVLYSIVNEEPQNVQDLNPEVSDELAGVIHKCLSKVAANRYESASALFDDLQAIESGKPLKPANAPLTTSIGRTSGLLSTVTNRVLGRTASGVPRERTRLQVSVGRIAWVVVAAVALVSLVLQLRGEPDTVFDPNGEIAVAVLPFTWSSTAVDSALVDGLLSTVTSKLAQIGLLNSRLAVVPVVAVLESGTVNPREAFEKFQVVQVVQGDLQFAADAFTITLQLVDAARPRILALEEKTILTDRYDELPGTIVGMLTDLFKLDLSREDQRRLTDGDSQNSEAYKFYIQGAGYASRYEQPTDTETAIGLYELAVLKDSSYALAYAGLALSYLARWRNFSEDPADFARAVAAAEKAKALDDGLAEVRYTLGYVYQSDGRYEAAELEFLRTIDSDKNFAEAYWRLGRIYEQVGKLDLAEEKFKDAIRINPGYWLFHLDLGQFYDAVGRHKDAIAPFITVTKMKPKIHYGFYNVAIQFYVVGDLDRASEWFEKSRKANPHPLSEAHYFEGVGDIKLARNDFDGAADDWRRVVAIIPAEFNAWKQLGDALYWAGDEHEAKDAWQKADSLAQIKLGIKSNDIKALAAVAMIAALSGNRRAADVYLERLNSEYLASDDYVRLTIVLETLNERNKALEAARQAFASGSTLFNFESSPWLDSMCSTPEFKALANEFK